MTAALYTRSIATVKRMLDKYGGAATIRRTNKQTGIVTAFPTRILVVQTVNKVLGETSVQLGDDQLLMQTGEVPIHGDRIVYGAENRVIVQPVDTLIPDASTIIFIECYARKG